MPVGEPLSRNNYFRLEGTEIIECTSMKEWSDYMETADRHVFQHEPFPEVQVSTVFLGSNHNGSSGGLPVLFETLVFGGPLDGEMDRYCTWTEASQGHAAMLVRVFQAGPS